MRYSNAWDDWRFIWGRRFRNAERLLQRQDAESHGGQPGKDSAQPGGGSMPFIEGRASTRRRRASHNRRTVPAA
jgi:hypothetical protein